MGYGCLTYCAQAAKRPETECHFLALHAAVKVGAVVPIHSGLFCMVVRVGYQLADIRRAICLSRMDNEEGWREAP